MDDVRHTIFSSVLLASLLMRLLFHLFYLFSTPPFTLYPSIVLITHAFWPTSFHILTLITHSICCVVGAQIVNPKS